MKNSSLLNIGLWIFKIFVGLIYVFAGIVKLVDPVGAGIKFHDYLEAFGFTFLQPAALLLAVLSALAEFVLGAALLLNIFKNKVVNTLFGVTVFFTLLTFVLALTNPVSDCGCFGDAIKLTNWQTFYKNLIILAVIGVLFLYKSKLDEIQQPLKKWLLLGLILFIGALIPHYSFHHLPIIDFRPYAVGNHLPSLMEIPEGVPQDEYKSVFYYSKAGETKQFDESNYPWQDSTWVFMEMKSELITKGYEPPIHDFVIESQTEGDLTSHLLNSSNLEFILIAPKLDKLNPNITNKITFLCDNLSDNDQFLTIVTSSTNEDINNFISETNINMKFANADITLLKTIIRSKAGLVVLKDGIVVEKYSYTDYPSGKDLKNIMAHLLSVKSTLKSQLIFLYLLLLFGAGILLIHRFIPKT